MTTEPEGHAPDSQDARQAAITRIRKKRALYTHILAYVLVNVFLIIIWLVSGDGFFWPVFVLFGWGIGVVFNIWDVYSPQHPTEEQIRSEMDRMSRR